jgi:hypothetical protein
MTDYLVFGVACLNIPHGRVAEVRARARGEFKQFYEPHTARPHENVVREALLRVLRQHGTGRRKDDCVSVR